MNTKSILAVLAIMLMLSGIASANISGGVPLTVSTNTAPVITVVGANPTTIERYSTYTDEGATATDAEDGDLTSEIGVSGTVLANTVGTYTVTYTVTDSQGATDTKTRTVNVVDTVAPADVTGLAAGTITTNSIQITWSNTDALLSPDFTNILISVTDSSGNSVTNADGDILDQFPIGIAEAYIITGLDAGEEYSITVYTQDDQL